MQEALSPCPSNGALATTAPDNCHNSQLGDVAGKTRDQAGGPRVTTVPGNSAASSLHNALHNAGDQGLRPRSTMGVPWPQPQLGPHHTQPEPSRDITPTRGKTT